MNQAQPLPPLVAGLVLRPAVTDDAQAILDLVNAISQVDEGKVRYTLAQIHASWASPGFDLSSDSLGVFDRDGSCLGEAEIYDTDVQHVRPLAFVGVHPAFRETPIGRHLLAFLDERLEEVPARAADGLRVAAVTIFMPDPTPMTALLREWGWMEQRHYWTMAIDLPERPPEPDWPEGITVRACTAADAPVLHQVENEAFADHFGFEPRPFDVWHLALTEFLGSSPDLWFLAESKGEPTGMCVCALEQPDDPLAGSGYIGSLGVLRPYRGRGLGVALLRHGIATLYARGRRRVTLHVDSESVTGATRLYERAGMSVVRTSVAFERELRPGAAAGR
jgi:mycothiol synthase